MYVRTSTVNLYLTRRVSHNINFPYNAFKRASHKKLFLVKVVIKIPYICV